MYGHMNNARYLTFFELVIMRYLEIDAALDFNAQVDAKTERPVTIPDATRAALQALVVPSGADG